MDMDNSPNNHKIWTLNESNEKAENGFSIATYTSSDLYPYRHSHTYIQIYFINEGALTHEVNGKTVTLTKGDLFIISPHVYHTVNLLETINTIFTSICFYPSFILSSSSNDEDLLPSFIKFLYQSPNFSNADAIAYPKITLSNESLINMKRLIDTMLYEFNSKHDGYFAVIKGSLNILLVNLARSFVHTDVYQKNKHLIEEYSESMENCINYINTHFKEDLKLDAVAQRFMFSRTYFCKYFKQHTKMTFNNYINELRINHAKYLIGNNSYSLARIATECGFNETSSFCRKFKAITGVPPSEYRNYGDSEKRSNRQLAFTTFTI